VSTFATNYTNFTISIYQSIPRRVAQISCLKRATVCPPATTGVMSDDLINEDQRRPAGRMKRRAQPLERAAIKGNYKTFIL
jgi:hypothetical protein